MFNILEFVIQLVYIWIGLIGAYFLGTKITYNYQIRKDEFEIREKVLSQANIMHNCLYEMISLLNQGNERKKIDLATSFHSANNKAQGLELLYFDRVKEENAKKMAMYRGKLVEMANQLVDPNLVNNIAYNVPVEIEDEINENYIHYITRMKFAKIFMRKN